ncbi:MAG: PDZ domain-containing protein [Azoarcus sp.]|jgi:C-terminal processing protease CtpA/Prc|nr:PDZ domain-containing protein [Azoarcus sp.]
MRVMNWRTAAVLLASTILLNGCYGKGHKPMPSPPVTHSIVGIGIRFEKKPDDPAVRILDVIPEGSAAQAKLQSGDMVTTIDGKPVASLSSAEVTDLIRGEAGTLVTLKVLRGSRSFTVIIERRAITVSVDAAEGR